MRSNPGPKTLIVTLAVVVAALIWVKFAGAQGNSNAGLEWSPALGLKSQADLPSRMRGPVFGKDHPNLPVKVTLTNGNASREVDNCEEYLNIVNAGFYPDNNRANKMAGSFVRQCYVLRDLKHARSATSLDGSGLKRMPSANSFGWTKDSLAQLPPLLVAGAREVTTAAEQAEARGESWQQFDPSLKVTSVTREDLGAEDDSFLYSLEIVARGDFDGDGTGDVAIYGCATGKRSTWFECKYFVFSPTSRGKLSRLNERRAPYRMKVKIPD